MLSGLELSYVAGFFDGEGSIVLTKRIRKNWTVEHTLSVAIGQKDGDTLDWIAKNFSGYVYLVKRDNSFYWRITNRNAEKFLRQILPYIRYKKPQALLALKLYDEWPMKKFSPVPQQEIERRENIRLEMKRLKKEVVQSKLSRCND